MSWREQLRRGSFRGVAFLIDGGVATGGGRRVALHQYPERDLPWGEDLGREARSFRVHALVIGPQYMAARDRLMAALEAEGPGTLVHPYYGTREVVVHGKFSIRESTREGGLARFSIPFAEAGAKREPAARPDTARALGKAGDAAAGAAANSFENAYNVADLPLWVTEQSLGDIASLTERMRDLAGRWTTLPDALTDWLARIAEFASATTQLVRAPADLARELDALMASLGWLFAQPTDALQAYDGLADWQPPSLAVTPVLVTPERVQAQANRAALVTLAHTAAIAGACRAVAATPAQTTRRAGRRIAGFDNRRAALEVRGPLVRRIGAQQRAADAATFGALADLQTALVRDIDRRAAPLPRIVAFTPPATRPALTIAERLFDEPARAADIVARNRLAYPGFVPGGRALEVLDA